MTQPVEVGRLVKRCDKCKSLRPEHEFECQNEIEPGRICGFDLFNAEVITEQTSEPEPDSADTPDAEPEQPGPPDSTGLRCPACGASVESDDAICLTCGAPLGASQPESGADSRRVGDWLVITDLPATSVDADLCLVRRDDNETLRLLRHFRSGFEPDPALQRVLSSLDNTHVARLIDSGRDGQRAFEVWEHVEGPTLAEHAVDVAGHTERVEEVAFALIRILALFERHGIRHGGLQPSVVRVSAVAPLLLTVTDFASARVAEFDVETLRLRQTSRYMAPEAVADASTAASDWWSLGIILLEMVTGGRCFDGVNERAFLLHLVARGIDLPEDLSPRWRNLLEGLLIRNHDKRWRADQALRWVEGEANIPTEPDPKGQADAGPAFQFAGQTLKSPIDFTYAAADAANWHEALAALDTGRLTSWLAQFDRYKSRLSVLRKIAADQKLSQDIKLALTLAAINEDLPLCVRGDFVLPNALLVDPVAGVLWLSKAPQTHLRRLDRPRDYWLLQLAERADRVRARAREARLEIDEERFIVLQLATSTAALEGRWNKQRSLFPDSTHPVLLGLIERSSLTDEDLLLLLATRYDHFRPTEEVVQETERLAAQADVPEFDRAAALAMLQHPRRDLVEILNERIPGFYRCDREMVDGWIDAFQTGGGRLSLPRLLVALSVPAGLWAEPPHQKHVEDVLDFLGRRVLASIQRGALVQMRATAKVADLSAIEAGAAQGQIVDAIVTRTDSLARLPITGLPAALVARISNLLKGARDYQRETGLQALYLAYPVLTLKENKGDGVRSRIAPLLFWPVRLEVATGAQGEVTIGYDNASGRDVELNPALETILGPHALPTWQAWRKQLLDGGGVINRDEVLASLPDNATVARGKGLLPIPKAAAIGRDNELKLHDAAALMLVEFASQAIATDLRQLKQRPLDNTALQTMLRLGDIDQPAEPGNIPHLERYLTLDADPSQEQAVLQARAAPGLVVQGPPGTGKSQTIVNIVTDCLGRGETVLVVCEKKAALDIVQKRLAGEKLDHRLIRIEDTGSDRQTILNQLRSQVTQLHDATERAESWRTERQRTGAHLEAVEARLDAYHFAVHAPHDRFGLSYREVLAIIAEEDEQAEGLLTPRLRGVLGPLDPVTLESVIAECAGLIDVWLDGGVPGAAVAFLSPLPTDAALAGMLSAQLGGLSLADGLRQVAIAERDALAPDLRQLGVDADTALLGDWLDEHAGRLREVPADIVAMATSWRSYFAADGRLRQEGAQRRQEITALIDELQALLPSGAALLAHQGLADWRDDDLTALETATKALAAPPGLLSALNIFAAMKRRRAIGMLGARGVPADRASALSHAEAAGHELALRRLTKWLAIIHQAFGQPFAPGRLTQGQLDDAATGLARKLDAFRDLAEQLDAAPVGSLWNIVGRIAANATAAVDDRPLDDLIAALDVHHRLSRQRKEVLTSLADLAPYLDETAVSAFVNTVRADGKALCDWEAVAGAMPHLVQYQTFRIQYAGLSPHAQASFAALAPTVDSLTQLLPEQRRAALGALMRREAATLWRDEIEMARPELQRIRSQIEEGVADLARLDGRMRELNRQMLAHIDRGGISRVVQWNPILATGGNRQRRLRQVFEEGRALGLMKLRPVWLVNPDVASRMLPLEAGLFDAVIFDEASQMRVFDALPSLYRARRCIVCGDEKQLPPTSFFGSRAEVADNDDDGWQDNVAAVAEDAEAEASLARGREMDAHRRHIKDCEDLLALSRGLLPDAGLQIHYRSAFRELIAFSNAAYYGNSLNVPARRSAADVARFKPIEVRRIDGVYQGQTNPQEADAIVDLLDELWRSGEAPSVGVVTFNMKQAELIKERIDTRAAEDRAFGRAHVREQGRKVQGEDVGFFVKNLENVQGDERDWIIFSTTFGRNEEGSFIRNFGALNQQGGERRLNVAVTRAKEKVLLVTSLPVGEISSYLGQRRPPTMARDYLQAYMRYAELVHEGQLDDAAQLLETFASLPEGATGHTDRDALVRQALTTLLDNGFAATVMPGDDAFSVDIAVSDPTSGMYVLGVEFDSPRHHLLRHARAREVWRPRLLQRSGLALHRILSASWVQDPAHERARLVEAARHATTETPS